MECGSEISEPHAFREGINSNADGVRLVAEGINSFAVGVDIVGDGVRL